MGRLALFKIYEKLYAAFGPQGWWPAGTPFEVVVGAILTQNTAWSNVAKAIGNLKRGRCLTFGAMKKIPEKKLAALIRPAGYFNVKARRLKNFIRFLDKKYGGDLSRMRYRDAPVLRQELLGVNGIGRETADSILLYALRKPVFVIDAYTKRMLSRHGLKCAPGMDYDAVQRRFMEALPQDLAPCAPSALCAVFNEYHALIVRLGKDYCKKTKPKCVSCPLVAFGKVL
jgi:endonuclease-3 related protein